MIISIALGIVLAVVILRLLPVMLFSAGLAGAVGYQVVRGLLKLSVQIVRAIVLRVLIGTVQQIRAVRFRGSVAFGLFLSVVIITLLALTR